MNNISENYEFIKGFGGKGGGQQAAPQPVPAFEDVEGFNYGGLTYTTYQVAKVTDLISEGPIEGLVSGEYEYRGRIGDLGYTGVIYKEYPLVANNSSSSRSLKSIYWNENPLIDSQSKFNFQQIDINSTKGFPAGTSKNGLFETVSYARYINERLRGPNSLALVGEDVRDFKRLYRISNKECKKININFKVSASYVTLKYQDLNKKDFSQFPGIIGPDISNQSFKLSTVDREIINKDPSVGAELSVGIGSVLYNTFKIRIQINPIYRDGFNSNSPTLDIVSSPATIIADTQDLTIQSTAIAQIFEVEFKGKITQGYSKQVALDMSSSFDALSNNANWLGWEITFLKTTPEDTFSSRASILSIESLTEIYSSSFRYPNSAIVTSKFNAYYFSKIPSRAYDVKLLKVKVPSNYDPLTKTYGNSTPITVNQTISTDQKTTQKLDSDFYVGYSGQYTGSSVYPPVTRNLIYQFDANNAQTGVSSTVLTGWVNQAYDVIPSPEIQAIKCVLGNGSYASPNGSSNKPKKGVGASEQSPNGKYGVTFLTTEYLKILNTVNDVELSDLDYSCTIFAVCKWHNSSSSSSYDQRRIIQSSRDNFVLGFWEGGYRNFYMGEWILGVIGQDLVNTTSANLSFQNTINPDTNTYVVGITITKNKQVTCFWQNAIYSRQMSANSTVKAPKGLAINAGANSNETSYCTVFEIIGYAKDLSKDEAIQVRNWLHKKWNVTVSGTIAYDSNNKFLNQGSLILDSTNNIKIPLFTICANGQRTPLYKSIISPPRGAINQIDLIPSRKIYNQEEKFSLSEQGFCSFYVDFYLKLSSGIADNKTYNLILREGRFNLALKIAGEQTSLVLTLLNYPVKNGKAVITKDLDINLYSTTSLKNNFRRITIYLIPRKYKANITFYPGSQNVINQYRTYSNDLYSLKNSIINNLGSYAGDYKPNSFIQKISFQEDINNDYISTTPTQTKKTWGITAFPQSLGNSNVASYNIDYFPDILNAELCISIDLVKQITCKLNISDYFTYSSFCVGTDNRSLAGQLGDFNADHSNNAFGDMIKTALATINYKSISDGYISAYIQKPEQISSTEWQFNYASNVKNVVAEINANQLFYDDTNYPLTPASFIKSTGNLKLFSNESSTTFGGNTNGFGEKLLGYVGSVKVNQIEFEKRLLNEIENLSYFSTDSTNTTIIYEPQVKNQYVNSNDYWDGTFKTNKEWTDNPAWCFYDLLTNKRYGAGNYISESDVDKWSLYEIAKYCDELVSDDNGGVEPRFTCNVYIQSQDDALKVLSDMASIFRGMFYYSNGYIYALNDMPVNTPVYTFTNANVTDGNFSYESTSLKDRNTAVYVRYNDKNNFYKPAVEYVENVEAIRKFGLKETELTAFGCTSRGQAQRLGRWLLASEYNETETVSFETGPEAVYLKPGDVVKVYDYYKKYKTVGGRLNLIEVSGSNNLTTGVFSLDRKLDFNFSGNQGYKFSILSPKYNLDPSLSNAVSNSYDYKEFRKSLVNSFIINSGNLITGQSYDSIRITGLESVMLSGINITGLSYFTGASGLSPKSIVWTMENSGILDGATDSDYDFYKIFRIQEASEGYKYVVLASQMYQLKYTQIESGLNIIPTKVTALSPTNPTTVHFSTANTNRNNLLTIGIYYDPSIKINTSAFKIFLRLGYDDNVFNPNTETDGILVSINPNDSKVMTQISTDNLQEGYMRVYGVNTFNQTSSSYTLAVESERLNNYYISLGKKLGVINVNPNTVIDIRGKVYNFKQAITLSRDNFFPIYNNETDLNGRPTSLIIDVPINFLYNSNLFPNSKYPYRATILPQYSANKDNFLNQNYQKVYTSKSDYVNIETISDDSIKNYSFSSERFEKLRNFTIGIDKISQSTAPVTQSTSANYVDYNGMIVVGYDNKDSDLKTYLNRILKENITTLTKQGSQYQLNIEFKLINQGGLDSFINSFYMLLVPRDEEFSFGVNDIIHNGRVPTSIKNKQGQEIANSHFVNVQNNKLIITFSNTQDSTGKGFILSSYKAYLIAVDVFMGDWIERQDQNNQKILNYYSSYLDSQKNEVKIYPVISDPIIIGNETAGQNNDIESVLSNLNQNYIHLTLNQTTMIENIFDTSVNSQSSFPNYTLSRKSVIYKPTTDTNLTTTKDDNVVSSSNPAYYKLSLQNRSNITTPISPKIPSSKRAYPLNGNKIFARTLKTSSENPKLLNGINNESLTENKYEIRDTIANSKFGKDGEEVFDISIIRLDDLSGDLVTRIKNTNLNFQLDNLITINSSNCNTQESAKRVFNDLITNRKIFNSPFNIVNVTPESNFSELGINAKNIMVSITSTQSPVVYTKYGPEISSYQVPVSNYYYPSVPVFEQIKQLQITLNFAETPTQNKVLRIYCFDGEEIITSAEVNTNQIVQGQNAPIKITLNNLKPKNYYTYTNTYNAGTSLRTSSNLKFWKFNDPENLAYAHLSAKKQFGTIPKYNFHIQTFELSVIITYDDAISPSLFNNSI